MNKSNVKKRLTIGLLLNTIDDPYQTKVWTYLADLAAKKDVNLILFGGKTPDSAYGFEYQSAPIINLIRQGNIDGLILLSATLWHFYQNEVEICKENFLNQLKTLPVVSIAQKLPGIPSILVDNKKGMRDLMDHLIEEHHCSKIVFIKGEENNQEANIRYDVYIDSLQRHNIPIDKRLVLKGRFTPQDAAKALEELIKAYPDLKFQAVTSANDDMALGASEYLHKRGYKIPEDVIITGFDDLEIAQFHIPPITTVKQPLNLQTETALDLLLNMIAGIKVPEEIILPTELVVRQSCGCFSRHIDQIGINLDQKIISSTQLSSQELIEKGDLWAVEIMQGLNWSKDQKIKYTQIIQDLISTLIQPFDPGQIDQVLLPKISEYLIQDILRGSNINSWMIIFGRLRERIISSVKDVQMIYQLESFFEKTEIMISQIMQLEQSILRFNNYYRLIDLRDIIQKLIVTFNFDDLMSLLLNELPRINIPGCYITLYNDEAKFYWDNKWTLPVTAEIILAYHQNGKVDVKNINRRFPSGELIPFDVLPVDQRYTYIIEPLYFKEDQYGFIFFEYGSKESMIYNTLRSQISSALKGALLFSERRQVENKLLKALKELERSNNKLNELSLKDELTGLYNRRGFFTLGEQHMKIAIRNNEDFMLIFADMDGLKKINDRYGHQEGDYAISQTARILNETFQDPDILARLGGDEFTVLVIGQNIKPFDEFKKELQTKLDSLNSLSKKSFEVSISLGAIRSNDFPNLNFDELMAQADKILYENKYEKKKKSDLKTRG